VLRAGPRQDGRRDDGSIGEATLRRKCRLTLGSIADRYFLGVRHPMWERGHSGSISGEQSMTLWKPKHFGISKPAPRS